MTEQAKHTTKATVMPVIGDDEKLLGVTLNGHTCVRPDSVDWTFFSEWVLHRIVTLPRDTESEAAKLLIKHDRERIESLCNAETPDHEENESND